MRRPTAIFSILALLQLPLPLAAQEDEAKKRDAFAKEFKEKAAAEGASINETARQAIAAYVKADKTELWARADRIREKIGKVGGSSTKIIREWRDNKERYR